jgi:cytochrome c-type biogenesis protein CcmE
MMWNGRRAGIAIGAGVVLLIFAYLVWGGIGSNLVYFLTPTELLAKGSSVYGTSVRLGGIVEEGSIRWDADRRELRFRLHDENAKTVEVLSTGVPPQMFSGGIGAVVEGIWTPDGVFHSHNLMVKHSNEYRAPMPGTKPPEYYRELFRKQQS